MEEKKQLKKLTLNKEEIVNLNDFEMRNLKGGSSYACAVVSAATAVSGLTIAAYTVAKDESLVNCEHTKEANCMGDTSKQFLNGVCMLPEVEVYSVAP